MRAALGGWTARGKSGVRCVPRAWGKSGRINVIGHLEWEPEGDHRVRFGVLEGPCRTEQVLDCLESLARQAECGGKPVVLFLDNAPFHRSGRLRARTAEWERIPAQVQSASEPDGGCLAADKGVLDAQKVLSYRGRVKGSRHSGAALA